MEEALKSLLIKFRTLSSDVHSTLDEIFRLISGKCYRVSYQDNYQNEKSFFLNQHSKHMLRDFLLNPEEMASTQSDYMKDYCFGEIYNVEVQEFIRTRSTEGSHFPYRNCSEYDLSAYQIYKEEDVMDEEHCLVFALERLGVNTASIHNFVINSHVQMTALKKIAIKLGINIDLAVLGSSGKVRINKYPKQNRFEETVYIALYKEHYFVYERVAQTTSLELIHTLFEEGMFQPYSQIGRKQEIKTIELEDCIHEQLPSVLKEKKDTKRHSVSYADTECITSPFHKVFLYARYSVVGDGIDYKVYQETGDYKGFRSFLNSFNCKHNLVYFHNLKYDWYMIKDCPFIKLISITQRDNNYYQVVFLYYGRKFVLQDSYKLIPKKLSCFPDAFDLQVRKQEFILYNLYSEVNAFNTNVDFVLYEDYTAQDYKEAFIIEDGKYKKVDCVIEESILIDNSIVVSKRIFDHCGNYFVNGKYYHMSHCRNYLHFDCLLLKQGMESFRKSMLELLEIDCFSELSLSSMVHRSAFNRGCYDGVYALEDNLRAFVSKSVQGGRVCSRDNMMWKCKGIIKPIDAKSMYPSAIRRICKEGGFPCGPAKIITQFDPAVFYYIVKIKILSIGKYQQLPFVSYLLETGERCYTNTLTNKIVTIDKLTLEDWLQFQQIEYEFIEGVYWDEGGNTVMGHFVEELYNARKQYTEENNVALSEITKLILNSMYGKTIMKPSYTKKVIRDNDKVDEYIRKNFERLISMERYGSQTVLYIIDSAMGHSNMAHVGGMILSMARRIINEVINIATDNNIHVLYQDTDSLHVVDQCKDYNDGLERLAMLYNKQYSKQLLGKELEQFDFDLKLPGCTDVYSEACIILGKKAYIHRVVGCKDGVLIRMDVPKIAGVNTFAMNEYPDKWNLYKRMYKGEKIAFDLTYGDGVMFQFRQTVTTRQEFKKELQFLGKKGEL